MYTYNNASHLEYEPSEETTLSMSATQIDEGDVFFIEEKCSMYQEALPFTMLEDSYLRRGILKFGAGKWLKILGWRHYIFHPLRTGESLRYRAIALDLVTE